MKQLSKIYLSFSLLAFSTLGLAEIKKPKYVNDISIDDLESGGAVIVGWIFGFVAIFITIYAIYAGYLFISGDPEKGMESGKNVIIGTVISTGLAGVAFAVIKAIG